MSSEDSEYEDVTEHVQGQSSGSELEDVPTVKKVNKAQASMEELQNAVCGGHS